LNDYFISEEVKLQLWLENATKSSVSSTLGGDSSEPKAASDHTHDVVLTMKKENEVTMTGDIMLAAGENVSLTQDTINKKITIAATVGSGGIKDYKWNIPDGDTSIDEFNDDSLDEDWIRVDKSGGSGRVIWGESGEILSCFNHGGDSSSELHALLLPVGTEIAVGEAIETCLTVFGTNVTNYTMGGLILTDGTVFGSGNQVFTLNYMSTTAGITHNTRLHTGFDTQVSTGTAFLSSYLRDIYVRLRRVTTDTWRCEVSPNGIHWFGCATVSKTFTPTHMGILSSSWGTSLDTVVSYEYFRRTSRTTGI